MATLIVLGIFSAGLGLKGFLLSGRFIDGGVTGISMLLSNVLGWHLAILILVINLARKVLHVTRYQNRERQRPGLLGHKLCERKHPNVVLLS